MKKLSRETVNRLILLHELLLSWKKEKITSIEIAENLACKDSLVRWDFRFLNLEKGSSSGYKVLSLLKAVEEALDFSRDEVKKCCIVGLGRLGAALLDDGYFLDSGFKILAGFDSSVNRVEMLRSTFELFPANRIESVCWQKHIEYAFLCTPESEVEKMLQRLLAAGIKGIVNYTKSVFKVPDGVKVVNISPVTALMSVSG